MNILLVATELAPYVARTPAAESIASLAKALRLLGHEVTLVLPRLPAFEESGLLAARRLSPLALPSSQVDSGSPREALIFDISLPSGAKLVLLGHAEISWDALGASSGEKRDLAEARAIGWFSDAWASFVQEESRGKHFDVVHAHGAAAGLGFLKLRQLGVADVAGVLTVHDGRDAGTYDLEAQGALGVPESLTTQQGFKSGEELSLLKGVLPLVDTVLAPSETYARELLSASRFGGISRAFRGTAPTGILGGVDHSIFNPATDSVLTSRYDAQDPSNKGRNKSAVLVERGLPLELSRPLVFFEEVDPSDGSLETVLGAAVSIARLDVTLLIAPARELTERELSTVQALESHIQIVSPLDARLRRRLLAASDFYWGIERHNPSGQRLLEAARYGAVPVALAVDAARDVVIDADAELATGTGILFDSFSQRGVLAGLGRAVTAFRHPTWTKLLSRVLRQDLAWDRPARRHLQVYRQAAGSSRSH